MFYVFLFSKEKGYRRRVRQIPDCDTCLRKTRKLIRLGFILAFVGFSLYTMYMNALYFYDIFVKPVPIKVEHIEISNDTLELGNSTRLSV